MNRNRTLIVVLGLVLVALVAGGLALLLSGEDDSSSTGASSGDPAGTDVSGGEVSETQPVDITGDPLPPLDEGPDLAIGLATLVIEGASFDGTPITIGGPTAQPTMYVFLAHWCPHCNDEIPELIELSERGEIPADLAIVGISTGVAPDRDNYPPSEWLAEKGWPWPVMADDEAASAFLAMGGSGFPYSLIAGTDGSTLARAAGSRPAVDIDAWMDEALASAAA